MLCWLQEGEQAVRKWGAFVHEGECHVEDRWCSLRMWMRRMQHVQRSVVCGGEDGLAGGAVGGEWICGVCALELGGELRQVAGLRRGGGG